MIGATRTERTTCRQRPDRAEGGHFHPYGERTVKTAEWIKSYLIQHGPASRWKLSRVLGTAEGALELPLGYLTRADPRLAEDDDGHLFYLKDE